MKNKNLIKARNTAALTQSEIARKIGITDTGYMNYEHGKREPKVSTAIKIADALGVENLRELWSCNNPN